MIAISVTTVGHDYTYSKSISFVTPKLESYAAVSGFRLAPLRRGRSIGLAALRAFGARGFLGAFVADFGAFFDDFFFVLAAGVEDLDESLEEEGREPQGTTIMPSR
jgi:hypothetical protein